MKVLYIHPDTSELRESQITIPIGIVSLSKLIKKTDLNIEYKGVNIPIEKKLDPLFSIGKYLNKEMPDVVLIDLHWMIYSYTSIELTKIVKDINSNCITILGGITATIYADEILKNFKTVDYITRGFTEECLPCLLKAIISESEVDNIPNLSFRRNNKVIHNEIKMIDSNAYYNYDDYDFLLHYEQMLEEQSSHMAGNIKKKLAWIPTGRGCQYNCSYCGGNNKMFKEKFCVNKMIPYNPNGIASCIEKLYKKYSIDMFGITHDFGIFSEEYYNDIFDNLSKLSFKPAIYNYLFQLPSNDYFKKYMDIINQKDSIIGLSVICGNEKDRIRNGKVFTNKELFNFLEFLTNYDTKVELYFIVNPYIGDQNYRDTLKLIENILKKYKSRMNLSVSASYEVIQPYSKKQENNKTVFTGFMDYYYRYSNKFLDDVRNGENIEYLIGDKDYDDQVYDKIVQIKELVNKYENSVDILYLYPPSGRQKEFEKALGLAYIEAYLKQYGYKSVQFIPNNLNYEEIIKSIKEINPKTIGISTYDMNYYYAKLLSNRLKKELNVPIIIGGPTGTFSFNLVFKECPSVDYILRGYGEESTKKLLDYLIKGRGNLENIPGLVYRNNNELKENKLYELPQDIDFFPSPYLSDIGFLPERKIVLTSRGCFHNCVYCNCAAMCNKKVYFHSVNRVISELKYISDNEPGSYVLIGDDAFTLNIERAKQICKRIIDEKINLKLFCETRVDRVDYELLNLMKQAGVIKIDFGLESSNPKILRNIKKVFYNPNDENYTSERQFLRNLKDVVSYCKKLGMDPMVNIISGLPGETIDDAKETLDFIKKLDINSYSHNYLKLYSGTSLYNEHRKYKYKLCHNVFSLPLIIKYPFDIKKITPLNNSVSRTDIVRMKKEFIKHWMAKDFWTCDNIENLAPQDLDINEELYFYVKNKQEKEKVLGFIIEKEIPSNNIVFIEDKKGELICSNYLDQENYIKIIKIKNNAFDVPQNYYTLLLVEKMNDTIMNRFKELKVNPFINRFVLIEGIDKDESINNVIYDYCNTHNSDKKLLLKFSKYVNYELDNLDISVFQDIIYNDIFTDEEIAIIEKFLKYYLLGVDDDE